MIDALNLHRGRVYTGHQCLGFFRRSPIPAEKNNGKMRLELRGWF